VYNFSYPLQGQHFQIRG